MTQCISRARSNEDLKRRLPVPFPRINATSEQRHVAWNGKQVAAILIVHVSGRTMLRVAAPGNTTPHPRRGRGMRNREAI